ncbi:MAG: glutamine-hydrolyzing GMP synthase [Acidobacteria bacterium]|nr:glutamine-hydrolyzing GMP synthase [Acidobacteriota bacterium]
MSFTDQHRGVLILDFGSQYTQLIARRIRESGIYCEILPYNVLSDEILSKKPQGLILSGGPSSVYDANAPQLATELLEVVDCPILAICYGLQLLAYKLGGEVRPSSKREYGYARLNVEALDSPLFVGLPKEIDVWMSHGDEVISMPPGFRITAVNNKMLNAMEDLSKRIYAVQFHPEVAHTIWGKQIIQNFLYGICHLESNWSPRSIISEQIGNIQNTVGDSSVICGLSGGVDSAVAAALVHQAIGKRQICVFVDTGLLREGEFEQTRALFERSMNLKVIGVRASDKFLSALAGVDDPEKKRKIIGKTFIDIFEEEAQRIGSVEFLVQGTLYPDVIESVSVRGPSSVIKSHHNVGGLPERMRLKLIEPLRELFKDEVRKLGHELDIPAEILNRHPFPGPGLAIRIIGEVKYEDLKLLRNADRILEEELKLANLYQSVWQAFPVLLPISSVGVMGDYRTYERVIAVRVVTSTDGMTADWARLPYDILARISTRIISEVCGINRLVYDITSKPPSTIEWE